MVEEFVEAPSLELLERCTKDQLIQLAEYFKIELTDKRLKENIKVILKSKMVEKGILSADDLVKSQPAVDEVGVVFAAIQPGYSACKGL